MLHEITVGVREERERKSELERMPKKSMMGKITHKIDFWGTNYQKNTRRVEPEEQVHCGPVLWKCTRLMPGSEMLGTN